MLEPASPLIVSSASRRFYGGFRLAFMGFARLWLRLEVQGQHHIPTSGAFILAPAGHRSILDTGAVLAATPRMLRYMGADKYFKNPVFGWLLRSAGGFPVARESTDRAALRASEAMLNAGQPLVIFPESTRFSGPTVQPIKEGAVFMAARVGVPIIPVGIGGAESAWPKGAKFIWPSRVTLVIGEPIPAPVPRAGKRVKRSEIAERNTELRTRLQGLFDRAQLLASR